MSNPDPAAADPAAADPTTAISADHDVWATVYPVEPDYNWGRVDPQDVVLCEAYSPVRVEYVPEAPPKAPEKRRRKPVKRYGFE